MTTGVYDLTEASRLLRVNRNKLYTWVAGRPTRGQHPLFQPDLPTNRGRYAISFLDLIELAIIKDFRGLNLSMQAIRKAIQIAREMYNDAEHPLCTKRFETDGQTIFARVKDDFDEERIIDCLSKQLVFVEIMQPLFLQLERDEELESVIRWWPLGRDESIVIDPRRSFGRPIVAQTGTPTLALYRQHMAGDSIEEVADWYEIEDKYVRDAVKYESKLAA
jgi:uncharacterized protein (DUF433 family)